MPKDDPRIVELIEIFEMDHAEHLSAINDLNTQIQYHKAQFDAASTALIYLRGEGTAGKIETRQPPPEPEKPTLEKKPRKRRSARHVEIFDDREELAAKFREKFTAQCMLSSAHEERVKAGLSLNFGLDLNDLDSWTIQNLRDAMTLLM